MMVSSRAICSHTLSVVVATSVRLSVESAGAIPLIAIAALLIALPVAANAQTSRVEGMALQGDYIKDFTGIYTYPSQVSNVGNLIYGEFGNDAVGINLIDDRAVGAVLGNLWDGRFGTWAIHIRE